MKLSLAAVTLLSIGFVPHVITAQTPAVRTVSAQTSQMIATGFGVASDNGKTTVAIAVNPGVDFVDFTLEGPNRIVVDLRGATIAKPSPVYDGTARGPVLNIRAAQYQPNVVRVVIDLQRKLSFSIQRSDNGLNVVINSNDASFTAWSSHSNVFAAQAASTNTSTESVAAARAEQQVSTDPAQTSAQTASQTSVPSSHKEYATQAIGASGTQSSQVTTQVPAQSVAKTTVQTAAQTVSQTVASANVQPRTEPTQPARSFAAPNAKPAPAPTRQRSTQAKITVNYQDADIRDVIAAFATFANRTIVVGRDVEGTITAEIRNQPWDVALKAILQGHGFATSEDALSGIITVDSYANILAKQSLEPLVTRLVPINYAKADSLAAVITKLLVKDCYSVTQTQSSSSTPNNNCVTRGAVAANPATNTIIITETPSRIADILSYVESLDVRTPQVAIKAKIVFVNRTDIENLGISYDIGTRNHFLSQLVPRTDPSTLKPVDSNGDGVPDSWGGGQAYSGDRILLGGNTLAGIANANNRVTSPALSLIYSAALGKYSLTSFLDALQEVRLADLQAEPSIVTVDNREATIQVGQDVPVRVLDASTASSGDGSSSSIPRATVTFRPVGIILKVTPHITNNRQILLDVHAENSDAQIASSDVGYVFNKQSAVNRLLVRDGETAVIGGLTVTQVSQSRTGIPILVNLPFIGRLFGTTRKSEEKRDLLILITPHIVDEGGSVAID